MILSRTLAKRRIAAGVRPTRGAAWLPVLFDSVCLIVAFLVLFRPFQLLTDTFNFPVWATITALLATGFIPVQAVLIFSSLWASKSRYVDDDKTPY
jgi:formate-dependent nitrite reductase membrane component NrfD